METLILVGGGHAHLYVVKKLKTAIKKRLKVILISDRDKQYYSGMASGTLEGYYSETDMTVDLESYCSNHQIEFMKQTVVSVNPISKDVNFDNGLKIHYDYISFDIGSIVKTKLLTHEFECFYVKPLYRIKDIESKIMRLTEQTNKQNNIDIVVVGTGAAGIEVGLATKTLAESKGMKAILTFVGSKSLPLSGISTNFEKPLLKIQSLWQNIHWSLNDPGIQIVNNALQLASGKILQYDVLIIATGVKGSEIFSQSNIKTDANHFMITNQYLQSEQFSSIFGAGDCITFNSDESIPKNGVYAIKQASVLVKNIERQINKRPLKAFKPQKRFLSIIALREGSAILIYASFIWVGRIPFMIKKWIDQKYMRRVKK